MGSLDETVRLHLRYPPQRVREPVVYRLVVDYGLVPNIRKANIDIELGGFIFLELTGEHDNLERGIAWMESLGIAVSAIGLDGTQEWAV